MNGRIFFLLILVPIILQANDSDTSYRSVKISFRYHAGIFPPEWRKSPIYAKGGSIDSREINRSKQVTFSALTKYPSELLRLNLEAVYWLKKMSFYDVGYGGTNSNSALYLTNDGEQMGYSNNYLEQTFHHEFSSILFRNYRSFFDSSSWKLANYHDFIYNDPEDGVGAIRNNSSSQDLDTMLCREGMLTQYALSSLENDLNTFAQNLFSPSPGFWKIVDQYPRVRRKALLLIEFYARINPVFTEEYFRKFAD